MAIVTLPCGPIQANCYIVSDDNTNRCIIIDPGDAEQVLDIVIEKGLSPVKIVLTHGHFDHCMGVAKLSKSTGAEICMHREDEELVNGSSHYLSTTQYGLPPFTPSSFLSHGDIVSIGTLQLQVLHTPGHSKGSICFVDSINRIVFSGDTLFCESIGRTDLYGGSMHDMFHSVFEVLFRLPGDYTVLPGHGESTTIEHEMCKNPLVKYEDYFRQKKS